MSWALFVRRRLYLQLVFVGDRVGHAVAADAAEDRGIDIAHFDAALTVRFAVGILHAVAGDTGDTFTCGFGECPYRLGATGAQRGGNGHVAAHAEVADRALREIIKPLLELVEHRRDLGVRVGRDAPLLIYLFVADGAFAGRGVGTLCVELEVRIHRGRLARQGPLHQSPGSTGVAAFAPSLAGRPAGVGSCSAGGEVAAGGGEKIGEAVAASGPLRPAALLRARLRA